MPSCVHRLASQCYMSSGRMFIDHFANTNPLCVFSYISNLDRAGYLTKCCHNAAPQPSALLGGDHDLLLPLGPQGKEDLSKRPGRGLLSTDNKHWIRRFEIFFFLTGTRSITLPVDVHCSFPKDLVYYISIHQMSTVGQGQVDFWAGRSVFFSHIPPMCSFKCC